MHSTSSRVERREEVMIAEFGHYALVLALALALVQACVQMIGARKNDPILMAVAGPTAVAQFCFVTIAFAALMSCYVRSDFSVVNVFENSHPAKPLVYKLTYNGKSVTFALNDLRGVKPPAGALSADEVYLGPIFDASAIRFFLFFCFVVFFFFVFFFSSTLSIISQ